MNDDIKLPENFGDMGNDKLIQKKYDLLAVLFSSPFDLFQVQCRGQIGSLSGEVNNGKKMFVGDKVTFALFDLEPPSEGFIDGQIIVNYLAKQTGYETNGVVIDSITFATN